MIAAIRISGAVKIKEKIAETLSRLRLRKKFVCVIVDEKSPDKMGMIKKLRDFIAYGEINQETLAELIKARGKWEGADKKKSGVSKSEAEEIAREIMTGRKISDFGLKPFFRLHPPRGGLKSSKKHYPKGVLGCHGSEINKLIKRML